MFPVLLLLVGLVAIDQAADPSGVIRTSHLVAVAAFGALLLAPSLTWGVTGMAGDRILYPTVAVLLTTGLIVMQRLQREFEAPNSDLASLASRHTLYVGASLITMFMIGRWFPLWPFLRRYKYLVMVLSLIHI